MKNSGRDESGLQVAKSVPTELDLVLVTEILTEPVVTDYVYCYARKALDN